MSVNYLNPEGLHKNPAFSHVVTVEGSHRTIYVGGQNAVDDAGAIPPTTSRTVIKVPSGGGSSIESLARTRMKS